MNIDFELTHAELEKDEGVLELERYFKIANSMRAVGNPTAKPAMREQAQQIEKYCGYKLNLRTRKITPIKFNVLEFGATTLLVGDGTKTRPRRTKTAIYCETRAEAEMELANLPHFTEVAA